MKVDVGDLEGVLTRYGLLLDKGAGCEESLEGWNVCFTVEIELVEQLHERVIELQGQGFTELVGR